MTHGRDLKPHPLLTSDALLYVAGGYSDEFVVDAVVVAAVVMAPVRR